MIGRVTWFQANCPAKEKVIEPIVSISDEGDKCAQEKCLKHECHTWTDFTNRNSCHSSMCDIRASQTRDQSRLRVYLAIKL